MQIDGGLPVPVIGSTYLCPGTDKTDHFCLGIVRAITSNCDVRIQWFQLPSKDVDPYSSTYTVVLPAETRCTHTMTPLY